MNTRDVSAFGSPTGRGLCMLALVASPVYQLVRDAIAIRRERRERLTEDRLRQILQPIREAALQEDAEVAMLESMWALPTRERRAT